jgi:hypothetical protein
MPWMRETMDHRLAKIRVEGTRVVGLENFSRVVKK